MGLEWDGLSAPSQVLPPRVLVIVWLLLGYQLGVGGNVRNETIANSGGERFEWRFSGVLWEQGCRRSFDLVYCCLVHCNHLFNSPFLILKTIPSFDNGFLKFMYFLWGVNPSLEVGTGPARDMATAGLRLWLGATFEIKDHRGSNSSRPGTRPKG